MTIEPDDDTDINSISKGLLFETLCWYIWYLSGETRESTRQYWNDKTNLWLIQGWKDFPRD